MSIRFRIPEGNNPSSLGRHSFGRITWVDFQFQPECVVWNFMTDDWSSKGCRYVGFEDNTERRLVCECDHLTNFAIIVVSVASNVGASESSI